MGNQILRINNINRTNDEGYYNCLARNSVNQISARAKLIVSRPCKC